MEILITALTLLCLVVAVILIATRGQVQRVFTAFGETVAELGEDDPRIVVLDGGLATELEARGHDLSTCPICAPWRHASCRSVEERQ